MFWSVRWSKLDISNWQWEKFMWVGVSVICIGTQNVQRSVGDSCAQVEGESWVYWKCHFTGMEILRLLIRGIISPLGMLKDALAFSTLRPVYLLLITVMSCNEFVDISLLAKTEMHLKMVSLSDCLYDSASWCLPRSRQSVSVTCWRWITCSV